MTKKCLYGTFCYDQKCTTKSIQYMNKELREDSAYKHWEKMLTTQNLNRLIN